jgi:branched-chain amino acid transport system substrate-binding protein
MKKRTSLKLLAVCALLAGAQASFAQQVIKIANIVELSGGGATPGTYFRDGIELAVKEINAAGGILGKKIVTTTADTQLKA